MKQAPGCFRRLAAIATGAAKGATASAAAGLTTVPHLPAALARAAVLGLSVALVLSAVLARPARAATAEPPGISLEIGDTPGARLRRGAGTGAQTDGASDPALASPPVGALLSVTAAGEAPGSYRRWGHLIGDRIRSCAPLAPGQRASQLPVDHEAGRVGLWFDRQATHTVDRDGIRALCIDYQIINSPRTTEIALLPPVTLATDDGSPLTIPATSVSIGPLIPDLAVGQASGSPPGLIEDRDAAGFVIRSDPARLGRSALALGLVLAGWLAFGWWRRGQARLRQPFTGARHELRRLRRRGQGDSARAWQRVHDAINRAAGRTISLAGLPGLVRDRPWLAPFAPRLAHFFAASNARFFAQPALTEAFALEALCIDLARAERQAGFDVAPRPSVDAALDQPPAREPGAPDADRATGGRP